MFQVQNWPFQPVFLPKSLRDSNNLVSHPSAVDVLANGPHVGWSSGGLQPSSRLKRGFFCPQEGFASFAVWTSTCSCIRHAPFQIPSGFHLWQKGRRGPALCRGDFGSTTFQHSRTGVQTNTAVQTETPSIEVHAAPAHRGFGAGVA